MTRYYCDYCDIFLTHDAPRVRRDHNYGWKHAIQVRAHFLAMNQDRMMRVVGEIAKDYDVRGELVPVPAPLMMRPPPGARMPAGLVPQQQGLSPNMQPGRPHIPMMNAGSQSGQNLFMPPRPPLHPNMMRPPPMHVHPGMAPSTHIHGGMRPPFRPATNLASQQASGSFQLPHQPHNHNIGGGLSGGHRSSRPPRAPRF